MADPKPVVPRQAAVDDVEAAVAHYRAGAGPDIAVALVDSLQEAFDLLGRHPAIGSPRYAAELDLPGLRMHPVRGTPYLVFYVDRHDHVDVWRLLHARRDIPESLQTDDG